MKYPRTYHLPWSPGGTKDDKKMKDVSSLIGVDIVISEKLDGSNSCITTSGVFSRSHGKVAIHKSYDLLKQKHSQLILNPNEEIFLENCYAVHSIVYEKMTDSCYVINIRKDNIWLSFDEVEKRAKELGLLTAPILFKGKVSSVKELEKITNQLAKGNSIFGGEKEGLVIRLQDSFTDFATSVAKWVRKDHVQTDEHWMSQPIQKQKF